MSSDSKLVALTHRNLPIAQMRSVYRVDEVEKRLDKLPQREHETLRATYERMLERGPERFQVKPGSLPAMDHLYEELPNFTEVLDDVRRQLACATTAATRWRSRPCCCSASRHRQDTFRARDLAPAGTGMGFISMSSLTAGWVLSGVQPVEGCAAGQGLRNPGRRRLCQPGDGRRRDRQGACRACLRPLGALYSLLEQDTAAPSPTNSPRSPSTPARSSGWPRQRRTLHPRAHPQPHERVRGARARCRCGAHDCAAPVSQPARRTWLGAAFRRYAERRRAREAAGMAPREMRRAWMMGFGNARLAGRAAIEVADLPDGDAAHAIGFMQ